MLVMLRDGGVVGDLFLRVSDAVGAGRGRATGPAAPRRRSAGCVDPAYAGQGYATEGAAELLRICFEDSGCAGWWPAPSRTTRASMRVMEKIGMRIEGRAVRASLHRDLGWVDHVDAADPGRRVAGRETALTAGPADEGGARDLRPDLLAPPHRPPHDPTRDHRRPAGRLRRSARSRRSGVDAEPPHVVRRVAAAARPARADARMLVMELDGAVIGDLYLHVQDAWAQVEVSDGPGGRRPRSAGASPPTTRATATSPRRHAELVRICFEDLGVRGSPRTRSPTTCPRCG